GRESENLVTPGGPLGLSRKADWDQTVGEYATILEPDHTMMLMSDGVIETFVDDDKKEQFEVEGVTKAIKETPAGDSFIGTIVDHAQLESRADDDATIITIRRR